MQLVRCSDKHPTPASKDVRENHVSQMKLNRYIILVNITGQMYPLLYQFIMFPV